jgi:hypothetical protein
MNHESRIKQLEKAVNNLKSIIKSAGLMDEFVPLSQAAMQFKCNLWVIRARIKSDRTIELGKHYQMNGNRYLILNPYLIILIIPIQVKS